MRVLLDFGIAEMFSEVKHVLRLRLLPIPHRRTKVLLCKNERLLALR